MDSQLLQYPMSKRLYLFCIFVKSQSNVNVWVYFWAVYSVRIFMCIITPIEYCLGYCHFVLKTVYCVDYYSLNLGNRQVFFH